MRKVWKYAYDVISRYFSKFKTIYAFIILSSIFTTAISIGIGFLKNVCKTKKSYPQWVLFMCISSLLISNFGFSNLVKILYPIFGYLGIIQVIIPIIFFCSYLSVIDKAKNLILSNHINEWIRLKMKKIIAKKIAYDII